MSPQRAFSEGYGMAIAVALATWLVGSLLSIHDPVVYLIGFVLLSAGVWVFHPLAKGQRR